MNVILYGVPRCPMCHALSQMLDQRGVQYEKIMDAERCIEIGLDSVPTLEINGERMNYGEAIHYLKTNGGSVK